MAKSRKINWDNQPLGKKTDSAIAKRLRCSHQSVARARQKRGIPAYTARIQIDWDKVKFGTKPDTMIAEELGVTSRAVQKQRAKRGIAPYAPPGKNFSRGKVRPKKARGVKLPKIERDENGKIPAKIWDKLPLGEMVDSALAKAIGCTSHTVTLQRIKRGIEAHPDTRSYKSKRKSRYDWDKIPLGQKPDADIARELGCSNQLVWENRRLRGIESFTVKRPKEFWDEQPLGKVSDEMLALMLDCTVNSVRAARLKRDIPPYGKRRAVKWDNA
jgi:hypothetical protein